MIAHQAGRNISQQKWDEIGRKSGLVPQKRFKHKLGEIYVADGHVTWHRDMQRPHWLTSWCIARGDGNLKGFSYFRSGIHSSKADRVSYARKEAERALEAAFEHDQLRAKDAKLRDLMVAGEA